MNSIPSYSLWWILVHKDYYLYQGNFEYLKEQKEYLLGLLDQLQSYIGQNNNEMLPETRFLDWATAGDKYATDAGLHSMMILAFQAAAWLCKHMGEFASQQKCLDTVERLLNCKLTATNRKQAVAMMALAGVIDAHSANKEFLSKKPCSGLSPFMGYYVLQARSLAKDYIGALKVIRDYWGAMLELGATTFWEAFDIAWKDSARIDQIVPDGKKDFHSECGEHCYKGLRHSLCHGWSGGPAAWLSEHVLGFRPLAPGSKKLLIKPELGDLEWAKGTFPTPYGCVNVSHSKDKLGKIHTVIEKPNGIEVVKGENIGITGLEKIIS
jgi:hypothetical protein